MDLSLKTAAFISSKQLFTKNTTLLIATSGGVDSMVLTSILIELGYSITLAHVNFGLRGEESNEDELFIKNYASKNNIQLFIKKVDTKEYAQNNKLSIQVAARNIRYEWLKEIRTNHNLDYILTAHHQSDSIETFFINLLRGSGIQGLKGIASIQNKIRRPMLGITKKEILEYAITKKIQYREDSSNNTTKYLRNKIRHNLIPLLQEIKPTATQEIEHSIQLLNFTEHYFQQYLQHLKKDYLQEDKINKQKIVTAPHAAYLLYEILHDYAPFTIQQCHTILQQKDSISATYLAGNYSLITCSDYFQLYPNILINWDIETDFKITFYKNDTIKPIYKQPFVAYLDKDTLQLPLHVRTYETGDTFAPQGMKGNKKKVTDFLKDKKINAIERRKIPIVTDAQNNILWVCPYRIDDTYKITANTKEIIQIEWVSATSTTIL